MTTTIEAVSSVIEAIPDAVIITSESHKILLVNTRACDMFGLTASEFTGADLDIIIPDRFRAMHREHVHGFFEKPRSRAMGAGLRFLGRRGDGTDLPVDIMLNNIEIDGASAAIAVIRDNSDRVDMEQLKGQLEAANKRLKRAQRLGRLAWWEADLDKQQLLWSSAMYRLLGVSEDTPPSFAILRSHCHLQDRHLVVASFDQLWDSTHHTVEYRIQDAKGDSLWVQEVIEPTQERTSEHVVIGTLRDITVEKQLEERLLKDSLTDELTAFYNRKFFNRQLDSEFSAFQRAGVPCSVIMFDFDHFKTINDQYGHSAGDQVLQKTGELVAAELRPSDWACRIGGEEFAVILSSSGQASALRLAERLRKRIAGIAFHADGYTFRATITAGVASFLPSDDSVEPLMKRADDALYRGKHQGRNCVVAS